MKIMQETTNLCRTIGAMLLFVLAITSQPSFAGETASGAVFERQFSDKKLDAQNWRRSTENRIHNLLDKQAITESIYHLDLSLDRSSVNRFDPR